MSEKERTCGECKWAKAADDLTEQRFAMLDGPIVICAAPVPGIAELDSRIVFMDKPTACPAFDDGSFEKAVRELIESLDQFISIDPEETVYPGSVAHRIMNIERLLKEREG